MVMPAIVLGTGLSAILMRQMRSSMLTSLGADYVRTARAKGLPERTVVLKHALRNSLITVTTIVGLQLGALISGVVVTESIFVIPGFGRLTLDAINQRDYALLQGVVLVAAAGYVLVNLTVDVLYSVLNPRIRVVRSPHVSYVEPSRRDRADGARAPAAPAPQALPAPAVRGRSGSSSRSGSSLVAIFAPCDRAVRPPATDFNAILAASLERAPARHRRARPRRLLAPRLGIARIDRGRRARDAARDGRSPCRSGSSPATTAAGSTP